MKNKILAWLFKSYAKKVNDEAQSTLELKIDAFKATLDIKDLIRERLKGIRPNNPEDNSILQNHLAGLDDLTRLAFLSKAYDILENNTTFKVVLESLIVEQEHFSILHSDGMSEVNFGRATINGVMLVEDTLSTLKTMYLNEKDNNKVITKDESFEVI